jgi:membrane-associated phospholipid phosphatase
MATTHGGRGDADGLLRSADWRRRALALIVCWSVLTAILIAVGAWVVHSSSVNAFDRHVTSLVVAHRSPALNAVMKGVTWLGSWVAVVATGILLAVLTFRRRLPLAALVLAVIAWAGESGGVTLAKYAIGRQRPPQEIRLVTVHGGSWPSGHTADALVVSLTVILVVVTLAQRSPFHVVAWVTGMLAVAGVAFSRVELGAHWTTDVLASLTFASAWFLVLGLVCASSIRQTRIVAATTPSFDEHRKHPSAAGRSSARGAGLLTLW